jgi:hypothetical protein
MIQRNRKTDNLAIEVPLFIVTYLFSFRFNFGALSGTPMTAIPANSLLLAFLSGTMELAWVEETRDNDGLEHYNKKNKDDIEVPLAALGQRVVQT